MRCAALLVLVAACATAAERPRVQVVASYDRPGALLPLALAAARAQHFDIAAIDTEHSSFVALPDASPARVHVVYLVNVEPLKYGRYFRYRRIAGKYVAIGVTPVAFAGGRELLDVPAAAHARAQALLLAIYDRTRSERELF